MHEAVKRTDFSYATSGIGVTSQELSIPVELTALNDPELENLRTILSAMVADSLMVLLTELSHVGRPEISVEQAYETIRNHSARHGLQDDSPTGLIDLLDQSYLQAMAHDTVAPAITSIEIFAVAFRELMIALAALLVDLRAKTSVDKALIAGLWTISLKGKRLALANVEIRRGKEGKEWRCIGHWLDTIEYVAGEVLTGGDLDIPLLLKIALEEDYAGVHRV